MAIQVHHLSATEKDASGMLVVERIESIPSPIQGIVRVMPDGSGIEGTCTWMLQFWSVIVLPGFAEPHYRNLRKYATQSQARVLKSEMSKALAALQHLVY